MPTQNIGLDHHCYRGAPRRIGSSWTMIEKNPPSEHGWAEHNRKRNWSWRPKRKHGKKRISKSAEQQARDLLAKLLGK